MLVSEYPTEENRVPNIFVHNLATAMVRGGDQVSVLWIDLRSPRRVRKYGFFTYEIDGVTVYRYAFPCGPFPRMVAQLSRRIAPRLFHYAEKREGSPDLIHAHFGTMAYAARAIRKKYGIPYVETEHSSSLLAPTKRDALRHKYYRFGYADASRIAAVSGALSDVVRTMTDTPVCVIPNIVSDAFHPAIQTGDHPFTFVSTARLIPGKGFELLLDAAADLVHAGHDFRLLIIGDGELRAPLSEKINALGISDRVMLLGQKNASEINEIYAGADAFVLPSEVETFGVVYIEAGAAGLPVIATDCGGPRDIVTEDVGLLIPPRDKAALTEAMQKLLSTNVYPDRNRIFESVRSRFGADAVIGRYHTLYEGVLL